jgi:hypothetical protein
MTSFKPVNLTRRFNAPATPGGRAWDVSARKRWADMPRGEQTFWGIPFRLGPKDRTKKGIILLDPRHKEVVVPLRAMGGLRGAPTHLCVLHFCDMSRTADRVGERLAEYVLGYADGTERSQPIRVRFEISPFATPWGVQSYGAREAHMPQPAPREIAQHAWGSYQTGVWQGPYGAGCASWIYAIENPRPEMEIETLTLRSTSGSPVAVLGVTLYRGPGHPLRHLPRRIYHLLLPREAQAKLGEVRGTLDMGNVTRFYAAPGKIDKHWLKSADAGLGVERSEAKPTREFLLHATGAEGATLSVTSGNRQYRIPFADAAAKGEARSANAAARLRVLHPRTTWLYVAVVDDSTGKPTPTRIRFCGSHGEYLPPYGHHEVVNEGWFEDYGGDLQLGGASFAYVPGRFQIELPVGEVYCEASKGFEYTPLRTKLDIKPGQRELELRVKRASEWRRDGWVTADTHVHFISPQTAWLEGQGEGLNVINLLASQWGRLFTNAADITGELSGCSAGDTLVWVGTENRHHILGHISMLGTHGDPVFPMCDGGPHESYLGDPDVTTLTEWAETCRKREGLVIRPHFPTPICEEPVYFALGQLDAIELRNYGNAEAGSLDDFSYREWYRYLNCGYRVGAVGGTDKMSAGMPVGATRTYAQLGPDDEFSYANWAKAVRAGRTFTTSGPLINLAVDGRGMGEEIKLPAGGGTVEVRAEATSLWPMHMLEVIVNGQVAAASTDAKGARRLSLKVPLRIPRSSWIAARCGSRLQAWNCWPIHLGAHTSPVYVAVGDGTMWNPSDAAYMLTLIDGGLTFLDTLSVRYNEERHRQMKAVFERARRELERRAPSHSAAPG